MVGPLVNASIAYSNLGQNDKAESSLRRALEAEPNNAAALFNLGLLLAEENRPKEAEQSLRAALASDPKMAAAAHNLGDADRHARRRTRRSRWCRKAHDFEPENPKYAHTLAFFLRAKGDAAEAVEILRKFVERGTPSVEILPALGGDLRRPRRPTGGAGRLPTGVGPAGAVPVRPVPTRGEGPEPAAARRTDPKP